MANDVEDILKQILQLKGLGIHDSIKFIEELSTAKRYLSFFWCICISNILLDI
jgi:sulfite reductase alpha subunit-like flavoprotein